jgi:hypothetical protein
MSSIWSILEKWILIGCAALLLIAVGLALIDHTAAGSLVASLFVVVALGLLDRLWIKKRGHVKHFYCKESQSTWASCAG